MLRRGLLHREPELLQWGMLRWSVLREPAGIGQRRVLHGRLGLLQWSVLRERELLQQRLLPKRPDLLQQSMLPRQRLLRRHGMLLG